MNVMAIRSETVSLFRQGIFSNRPLIFVVIISFFLQLSTIYLPFLNKLFKTQPLTINELAVCVGISSVVFITVEIEKVILRYREK